MVDFEMPLKHGGYITYEGKLNKIVIKDNNDNVIEINANELIKFTNTNFWKYLSK